MSPVLDDARTAARELIEAALTWADQDYGDPAELKAAAALTDAATAMRRAAADAGLPSIEALFGGPLDQRAS